MPGEESCCGRSRGPGRHGCSCCHYQGQRETDRRTEHTAQSWSRTTSDAERDLTSLSISLSYGASKTVQPVLNGPSHASPFPGESYAVPRERFHTEMYEMPTLPSWFSASPDPPGTTEQGVAGLFASGSSKSRGLSNDRRRPSNVVWPELKGHQENLTRSLQTAVLTSPPWTKIDSACIWSSFH